MGISEMLAAERNRFINLLDLLAIVCDSDQCSVSEAAKFLHLKLSCTQESLRPKFEATPCELYGRVLVENRFEAVIEAYSVLRNMAEIQDLNDILIYDDNKPVRFKKEFSGVVHYGFDRKEITDFLSSFGVHIDINIPPDVQIPAVTHDMPQRLQQLEAENARLVEQVADLERKLEEAATAPQDDEDPLHPKRETTYLNTIGALVELIQTPRPGRGSEAAVIREILSNYSERPGISKRTLEALFPEAKKRLQSD